MAIVQANFEINDDTYFKIVKGILQWADGAIRWAGGVNKGKIYEIPNMVSHSEPEEKDVLLDEIENVSLADCTGKKGILNNPFFWTAVVAAIGVIGYGGYHWLKGRKVKAFNKALKNYLDHIKSSNMDMETIGNLRKAIENLKKSRDYKKQKVTLSVCDIETILNQIEEYTKQLASANGYRVKLDSIKRFDPLGHLDGLLQRQEGVFKLVS